MKNPLLLAFTALIFTGILSGCNTASNMSREVPGWFNTDKASGMRPASPAATMEPESVTGSEAQANTGGPAKVALLLPLSGDKASLGKSFLDAAQMAVMDVGGKGFELLPKDTKSDAVSAEQAAREAVMSGAQLIIGPVFSNMVPGAKNGSNGIPVISLSNDWNMAGGNVYVMGFNPVEQVQRIAEFAHGRGVQNVAVLIPASSYGELVENTLHRSSLNIVMVQKYQKNRESIDAAVAAVAARANDIQGLVIPEGGAALAGIAEALFKNKITGKTMPMFGTGLWDDEDISRSVALLGGFYPASNPAARNRFMDRFQATQGYRPVRLATLAYDATALAAALAARGDGFHSGSIESANGFKGMDGVFRFDNNIATRALAVMEVTSRGSRVAEPAATGF